MNENVVITKETLSRLVHDVKDIIKNPLTDHGIYYHHDDGDMLKGYALIIGPSETIYEGGFYLFRFKYGCAVGTSLCSNKIYPPGLQTLIISFITLTILT